MMKKRFFALLLAFAILFCAVPVALAEAQTKDTIPDAESYLDLYVKDGLVALFDGYSVAASSTPLTEWKPVDLYGRAGYEDYINPASYNAELVTVGERFQWMAIDGGIMPMATDGYTSTGPNGAYLELSTLGEKLGTVYTVEDVYTHKRVTPVIKNGVLTNYSEIKSMRGRVSQGWIGGYNFGCGLYTGAKADGVNSIVNVIMEQMQFTTTSAPTSGYLGHYTWIGADAGATLYDSLTGDDGTDLSGYYVGSGDVTLSRSIGRLGVSVSGTSYISTIKVQYNIPPVSRPGFTAKLGSYTYKSTNEQAHKASVLRLAPDLAVTHSIRIYNKDLTDIERMQNHFADLIAFFDLEERLWRPVLSLSEEERSEVYATLSVVDFNDSRDTVVGAFEEAFSVSADVSYSGYGVAGDKAECLRYYFNVSTAMVDVIRESGVSVEIGGLVKMDSVELPTLSSYTHKLIAYGKNGAEDGVFVDKDTFAVSVRYADPAPEDYTTVFSARAYMKLTYPGGAQEITYIDIPKDAPTSLLSAFELLSEGENPEYLAGPETAAYVDRLLGGAIRYNALYLDASAPDGGDGSEERPYNDFAEAFSAAKSILKKAASPVKLFLLVEEGEYPIYETQTLTGDTEMRKGSYLYVVARGENVVLKTTKDISANDFVPESENVYSYQFKKGADGTYPSFRCLYVNDALATIATNGSDHSYETENLYVTAFDRTYSANSDNAKAVGKMYLPEGVVGDLRHLMKGASNVRTALLSYKIEMHITCQWNYNIIHVAGVDYNDYAMSDGQKHVAVYLDMDEYKFFQINAGYSTARRYVHMKNADVYLDEDGEYRYDEKNGKLYYYSTEGIDGFDFGYATLDNMFILRDVENLTISGISFTGMDDYYLTEHGYKGALSGMDCGYVGIYGPYANPAYGPEAFPDRSPLYMCGATNVNILGCRFYELPCEGIDVTGWAEDLSIKDCSFTMIGSAALRIGTHTRTYSHPSWIDGELGARNVYITNNVFEDIANEYYVPAVMICKLDTGAFSHNTIKGCTYSALSLGWSWWDMDYLASEDALDYVNMRDVEISYNYITDFMTEMADGGAIYMPMQNAKESVSDYYMNAIHHNCIVFSNRTGDGLGGMLVGIYFDASTQNWHCYENIIYERSNAGSRATYHYIYLQHINGQETHHILVEDNIILNVRATTPSSQHSEVYHNYFTTKEGGKRNLKEKGTVYINGATAPSDVAAIIAEIGVEGHRPDAAALSGNSY